MIDGRLSGRLFLLLEHLVRLKAGCSSEIDNKKSRLMRRDFDWCGGCGAGGSGAFG
jgi:hypothetical protein